MIFKKDISSIGQGVPLYYLAFLLCVLFASCKGNEAKKSSTIVEKTPDGVLTSPNPIPSTASIYEKIKKDEVVKKNNSEEGYKFKYDLSTPSNTFVLSSELQEISALSFDPIDNVLYAVNDEKGDLFSLDSGNGKILNKMHFGKNGDYEGIELGDSDKIYAIKSNGNITIIQKSDFSTSHKKTALSSVNDVEGLGYNRQIKMLLLACKGSANLSYASNNSKNTKAVYGWSTETETLIEDPILSIGDEKLISFFDQINSPSSASQKKKLRKRLRDFSPSGIAYNENEALYYLISSTGKLLILVDEFSKVVHIEFLDDIYFSQPEGICFGGDNSLYISNEGRGLAAKLMKFRWIGEDRQK